MNEEMGGRREGEGKKKEGRREGEGREKGGRKEMNEEMGERYRRKKGGRRAGVSFPGHSIYHAAMEKKSGSGLGTRLGRKKEGRGMWQMKRRAG